MNTKSRGMLVKAMPSVMKASAQVSPRALREVDRLNENPEKMVANAGGENKEKENSQDKPRSFWIGGPDRS